MDTRSGGRWAGSIMTFAASQNNQRRQPASRTFAGNLGPDSPTKYFANPPRIRVRKSGAREIKRRCAAPPETERGFFDEFWGASGDLACAREREGT
jgi:hypothetical protein